MTFLICFGWNVFCSLSRNSKINLSWDWQHLWNLNALHDLHSHCSYFNDICKYYFRFPKPGMASTVNNWKSKKKIEKFMKLWTNCEGRHFCNLSSLNKNLNLTSTIWTIEIACFRLVFSLLRIKIHFNCFERCPL